MSGIFSKPKMPQIPSMPPPKGLDESAANADQAERQRRARAYSYQDTILSSVGRGGGRPGRASGGKRTVLGGGLK